MPSEHSIAVILAAAGAGTRCGKGDPKQWRPLAGGTLVERSWRSFHPKSLLAAGQGHRASWLGVVVDAAHRDRAGVFCGDPGLPTEVIRGGSTRTESVRLALSRLPADIDLVAVHDAVRPFWPRDRWDALVSATEHADGAILAIPVSDTLKTQSDESLRTVDRSALWVAQTPQMFRTESLRAAHDRARADAVTGTDDAELVERIGGRVAIVQSTTANMKITTPDDWTLAERLVAGEDRRADMRVGFGVDAHRLGGERPLVLGGVRLAERGGLIGHSDGDVLLHAICDALLGAAALGDIGQHFPPGDERFAGVDSRILLRRTAQLLLEAGFRPVHIDTVVLAEVPRIAPFAEAMRGNIAVDLDIPRTSVSVKATTMEQMGFVGRQEGIVAHAVATVCALDHPWVGGARP
ncbi:MAG: 2-C-methyl-D-erythritol 4-phosphate cytidylyltransferase [Candidatus Zixiibacteriota bacterium]